MGLTFRKRDDFDKMMDDLGVSTVDLVTDDDKKSVPSPEKKELVKNIFIEELMAYKKPQKSTFQKVTMVVVIIMVVLTLFSVLASMLAVL